MNIVKTSWLRLIAKTLAREKWIMPAMALRAAADDIDYLRTELEIIEKLGCGCPCCGTVSAYIHELLGGQPE